jgi:hypothetical protein
MPGSRAGNVVLVATRAAGVPNVERLSRSVARDAIPARVWHGAELTDFVAGARRATMGRDERSPVG